MRHTPACLISALLSAALVSACHDTTAPGERTLKWASIAASDLSTFTCALTTEGAAYCWGNNFFGQLGDGATDSATDNLHLTPVAVAGGLRFTAIAVGSKHACGLTGNGAAYCWGANDSGQLGDGSDDAATGHRRLAPTAVTGGLTFASLSAGGVHTCGVTHGGVAYCWGDDSFGEVGDGVTITGDVYTRLAPTAVSGGLSFRSVATGEAHTCGLTNEGRVHCWGLNVYGQLGDSTQVLRTRPVPVAGGLTFDRLAAGYRQTCALRGGIAFCWGEAFPSGLGVAGLQYCFVYERWDGSQLCMMYPARVTGGLTFVALAAGGAGNCGVTDAGTAYCWGTAPSAVPGGLTFTSIATGGVHTCGVTADGAAYCWGDNYNGELGNGSRTNSDTPVRVATP